MSTSLGIKGLPFAVIQHRSEDMHRISTVMGTINDVSLMFHFKEALLVYFDFLDTTRLEIIKPISFKLIPLG